MVGPLVLASGWTALTRWLQLEIKSSFFTATTDWVSTFIKLNTNIQNNSYQQQLYCLQDGAVGPGGCRSPSSQSAVITSCGVATCLLLLEATHTHIHSHSHSLSSIFSNKVHPFQVSSISGQNPKSWPVRMASFSVFLPFSSVSFSNTTYSLCVSRIQGEMTPLLLFWFWGLHLDTQHTHGEAPLCCGSQKSGIRILVHELGKLRYKTGCQGAPHCHIHLLL